MNIRLGTNFVFALRIGLRPRLVTLNFCPLPRRVVVGKQSLLRYTGRIDGQVAWTVVVGKQSLLRYTTANPDEPQRPSCSRQTIAASIHCPACWHGKRPCCSRQTIAASIHYRRAFVGCPICCSRQTIAASIHSL